jgi:hypothetical protein
VGFLWESPIFDGKIYGFRLRFSLKPIHWDQPWFYPWRIWVFLSEKKRWNVSPKKKRSNWRILIRSSTDGVFIFHRELIDPYEIWIFHVWLLWLPEGRYFGFWSAIFFFPIYGNKARKPFKRKVYRCSWVVLQRYQTLKQSPAPQLVTIPILSMSIRQNWAIKIISNKPW